VSFGDKILKCRHLDTYDFTDTNICLMSAGGDVSREWSPRIGRQGLRRDRQFQRLSHGSDVPLIVRRSTPPPSPASRANTSSPT